MIRRALGLAALAYMLGFAAFMLVIPGPLEGSTTDAIVVPTGGAGRIDRGLDLIRRRQAHRLLVTGVAPGVGPAALAKEYHASPALFACCVDLDDDAVGTRSNAEEAARWARARGYHSLRLVTSDWHLARAVMELRAAAGGGTAILGDPVPSDPAITLLFSEYNKLVLGWAALRLGISHR